MSTITDFTAVDDAGFPVLADAHGNNVAFRCASCGGPVLAVVREHQRGASESNPSACRACSARYWVEAREADNQLVIHRVAKR